MKAIRLYAVLFVLIGLAACKAQDINKAINAVNNTVKSNTLTNSEIIQGLKEALKVGTNNSVTSASAVDGFFKNSLIKIPFPSEAQAMETKLRSIGMGDQCDKFVETLNRGAEEASKSAANIFLNAITNLTISDGMKILKGADNAATQYLQDNTTASLKTSFLPIVKSALQKVEVTKYWNPLATAYNKIPLVTKVNPDLDAYVTDKAISGLFKLIAAEEYKIRKDPAARITDILKKVFA
ncbi:MAG TPA: DUF4197 domain-containing protein [Bacteroidales bacterium]|nr:DUF4197 domain-containing protein [Bacteroidales bacterium]HPS18314.1 DUF4197 domain-containing protein [Bacteroidales bacterium]